MRILVNVGVSLASLLFAIAALELVALIADERLEYAALPEYNKLLDENYGYVLGQNVTWQGLKVLANGTVVYNVTYATDDVGRRTWEQDDDGLHAIFFGDSIVFGEGLEVEETLPYYFGLHPSYVAYNYGVSGYGPAHALAKLESGTLPSEVQQRSGIAFYPLIPAHLHRAAGTTTAFWIYSSPYYVEENGEAVRKGSFASGRPVRTAVYRLFNWMKAHSRFLQMMNVQLPTDDEENARITALILGKAKREYESQFNGTFIVIMHPEWDRLRQPELHDLMKLLLAEQNVTVIDYGEFAYTDDLIIPYDNHPKGIVNRELARLLAEDMLTS